MYQKVVIFLTLICLTFAKDIRLPKDSGLCPNSVKKFQQLLNQQNAQCQLNLKKLSSSATSTQNFMVNRECDKNLVQCRTQYLEEKLNRDYLNQKLGKCQNKLEECRDNEGIQQDSRDELNQKLSMCSNANRACQNNLEKARDTVERCNKARKSINNRGPITVAKPRSNSNSNNSNILINKQKKIIASLKRKVKNLKQQVQNCNLELENYTRDEDLNDFINSLGEYDLIDGENDDGYIMRQKS